MFANPVWGAFSDRTRSRLGRRVPWVLGGVVHAARSRLLLLSVADSAVLDGRWRGAWSSSPSTPRGPAAPRPCPTRCPAERRGLIGGLVAIAGTVGVLLGIKIAELTGSIAQGYLVIARRDARAVGALPRSARATSRCPPDHVLEPMDWKSAACAPSGSPRASTPTSRGRG